jgi:dienelactone hydrolase
MTGAHSEPVQIAVPGDVVAGDLVLPANASGLVVFAHGSGSSRFSSRNRRVASHLNAAGFATLLVDLLTRAEEQLDEVNGQFRFDIPLLGSRVMAAISWTRAQPRLCAHRIGLFGASTGAAAALIAAAEHPQGIDAIVSRGGRPDLAGGALAVVRAPTLLIVGGDDEPVVTWNREAGRQMRATVDIAIVDGATHLFEEPGALEEVQRLAADWFRRYLRAA